jgi:hypothetical protein
MRLEVRMSRLVSASVVILCLTSAVAAQQGFTPSQNPVTDSVNDRND